MDLMQRSRKASSISEGEIEDASFPMMIVDEFDLGRVPFDVMPIR